MFVPYISRHRQLLSSKLGQFTVACWSVVYGCCGCQRHTVCIEENACCSLERKHTSFLFAHCRRHPSCRFTVSHSTFFFSFALVYVGTSDRTGTFVECLWSASLLWSVRCCTFSLDSRLSSSYMHHVAVFRMLRPATKFVRALPKKRYSFGIIALRLRNQLAVFSLLILGSSMMPEIVKTAWKQDRK